MWKAVLPEAPLRLDVSGEAGWRKRGDRWHPRSVGPSLGRAVAPSRSGVLRGAPGCAAAAAAGFPEPSPVGAGQAAAAPGQRAEGRHLLVLGIGGLRHGAAAPRLRVGAARAGGRRVNAQAARHVLRAAQGRAARELLSGLEAAAAARPRLRLGDLAAEGRAAQPAAPRPASTGQRLGSLRREPAPAPAPVTPATPRLPTSHPARSMSRWRGPGPSLPGHAHPPVRALTVASAGGGP